MRVTGSLEAAGLSKEDKMEGVSGPKQGHTMAEFTLTWRQLHAQHQSYFMITSV